MSLFGTSSILALIMAVKEFFRWRAVKAEIEARRLIIDEMERVEDENQEIEKRVRALHDAGDHDAADLLQIRAVRRACFSVGLSELGEGANLQGSTQDVSGGGVCDQTAAGSDI